MKSNLELCHNSEVAASSAESPKQVQVLARVATHHGAIGRYERETFNVVARQAEPSS